MGSVWRGEDRDLQKPVVVKVPHPRFLAEPGFVERFEREMRELVVLEHPHIVRVLARGEHEGVPFLVLQYLAGGSLGDRLAAAPGRRLTLADAATWLPDVARTLDFVHGRGVVHRDVKPGNVLFDGFGNVYLSDFGIAKTLGTQDTGLTSTGLTPGSPIYMAPEQALGTPLSGAADQYALAVTLYEALAGRPPFAGESALAVILAKRQTPAPPVGEHAAGLPPETAAALARALARDPAERFPTCAAFASAALGAPSSPSPSPLPGPGAAAPVAANPATAGASPATPVPAAPRTAAALPPPVAPAPSTGPAAAPGGAPASGRRLAPIAGLMLLLGAGGWLAATRPWERPSPPAPRGEPSVSLSEPLAGAVLGSRRVRIAGRAVGLAPGDRVLVAGEAAEVGPDGVFRVERTAPADGPYEVRASVEGPSHRPAAAQHTVEIDTQPPVLRLTEPAQPVALLDAEQGVVVGRVEDAHAKAVLRDGEPVALGPDGTFRLPVTVPAGGTLSFTLVAEDRAGLRSPPLALLLSRRAPDPRPPVEPAPAEPAPAPAPPRPEPAQPEPAKPPPDKPGPGKPGPSPGEGGLTARGRPVLPKVKDLAGRWSLTPAARRALVEESLAGQELSEEQRQVVLEATLKLVLAARMELVLDEAGTFQLTIEGLGDEQDSASSGTWTIAGEAVTLRTQSEDGEALEEAQEARGTFDGHVLSLRDDEGRTYHWERAP